MVKIYIGSDHAGVDSKKEVLEILEKNDIEAIDLGPFNTDSVDYPIYAKKVCSKVLENEGDFGILICGSGTGMGIAANKVSGIRACLGVDEYSASMGRKDNNCNVLTLRSREFDHSKYEEIVLAFLNTEFSGEERHSRRVELISMMEKEE